MFLHIVSIYGTVYNTVRQSLPTAWQFINLFIQCYLIRNNTGPWLYQLQMLRTALRQNYIWILLGFFGQSFSVKTIWMQATSTPPNDIHFDKNETFQIPKRNPSLTSKRTSSKINIDFTPLRKQPAKTKLRDIIRTNDLVFATNEWQCEKERRWWWWGDLLQTTGRHTTGAFGMILFRS